jgi:hypothetical protein
MLCPWSELINEFNICFVFYLIYKEPSDIKFTKIMTILSNYLSKKRGMKVIVSKIVTIAVFIGIALVE